jgi:hypothetical protein
LNGHENFALVRRALRGPFEEWLLLLLGSHKRRCQAAGRHCAEEVSSEHFHNDLWGIVFRAAMNINKSAQATAMAATPDIRPANPMVSFEAPAR